MDASSLNKKTCTHPSIW